MFVLGDWKLRPEERRGLEKGEKKQRKGKERRAMNEEDTVGEKRVGEKKRQKRKIRDEDEKGSKGNGE